MYRYLLKNNPWIFAYVIMAPLRAVSAVVSAQTLSVAIEYATDGALNEVWKYVIFFSAYIVADLLIDAGDQYARYRVVKQSILTLKKESYHKVARMCYVRFFQKNSGDLLSNLTTDVETLRGSYFEVLLRIYSDFLSCAAALAMLVWISPLLGVFVLIVSLLQMVVPLCYAKPLEKAGRAYSDAAERQMQILKENIAAFVTAKVFHAEEPLEQNYTCAAELAEENQRKARFLREWTSSLSYVFNQVARLGVFLLGAVLALKGMVSVAEIVAASELIVYISYPVLWLNRELADLRTAKASAQKLEVLLAEPEDTGGVGQAKAGSGEIVVDRLGFCYGEHQIFRDFSHRFRTGKKYLIVGESGCGKSTLLHLLAGLRQDYTGAILLGSTELRSLSRQSLTQNICVINQEPFVFNDSLYNNVCLYEQFPEQMVQDVLCRVGLAGFVKNLPGGIHAALGESACAMSGGEKQRVVIARALVRKTPILLLDESTSHLDPATAAEIERLVLGLKGVTVLLVSHNATQTARDGFDEILELHPYAGACDTVGQKN